MRKVYRITVSGGYINKLLVELGEWGVEKSLYSTIGDSVTTSNKNVIDIATETFMYAPYLLNIVEVKE